MVNPLLQSDPVSVGPYRLLGRIGAGGMGVVYLAQAPGGEPYAVKVLFGNHRLAPEMRARLAREARSLTAIDSPHVVRIVEVDTAVEIPFLVMSYAEGEGLDTAVPPGGISCDLVVEYGAQLAGALQAIHAHGIVHRDLKPSNVVLGPHGVTLVDFGIASLDEEGTTALTREGTLLGSLAWLAPEVIAGGSADPRSDIFGLGLILGYLALGRHPYGTGRPEAVMYRIMHEQPDLTGLEARLRDIIVALLQRDPDARPAAAHVAAALRSSDQIPLPLAQHTRTGGSKHRWQWLLGGVSAAAIAGSFGLASASGAAHPDQATGSASPTATAEAPAEASPDASQPQAESSPAPSAGAAEAAMASPATAPTPTAEPSQPPAASFDFSGTCTWGQRELTYDENAMMGPAYYTASCPGAGTLDATAVYMREDPDHPNGLFVIDGELDGRPIHLEADWPGHDSAFIFHWRGTYDGVRVSLMVEPEGNGRVVLDGSSIGNGAIWAVGPQADINYEAYGPDDYLIWDNPSTVSGRYYGDENVTQAQAAALVNLVTVGVPASGITMLD